MSRSREVVHAEVLHDREVVIVASRECFRLVSYDAAPEVDTAELPDRFESLWEVSSEDRGGCRANRVGGDAPRAARSR